MKKQNHSKRKAALLYGKADMPVIPLHHARPDGGCSCGNPKCPSPGKHPRTVNGVDDATTDLAQIRRWWDLWPQANIGWRIGDEYCVVDIDDGEQMKNGRKVIKTGYKALKALEEAHGQLLTCNIVQESGGGGKHLIFYKPEGVQLPAKWAGGDIKTGNAYIVMDPSNHVSGSFYELNTSLENLNEHFGFSANRIPDWFVKAISDKQTQHAPNGDDSLALAIHNQRTGLSIDDFASALRAIPNDEDFDDRSEWLSVMAAVHHEGDGAEEYFTLADEWSAQWSGYDSTATRKAWNSFTTDSGSLQVTGRTVLKLAYDKGWKGPRMAGQSTGDIESSWRFALKYQDQFRHRYPAEEWLRWDKTRWADCELGEQQEAAKVIACEYLDEAKQLYGSSSTEENKRLLHKAAGLHHINRLRAMLALAASASGIASNIADYDQEPMLLGVRNGVLDLRSGKLTPARPSQLISKQAGCEFDPKATCNQWNAFIKTILPDPKMRRFVQRAVGYTLTGHIDEEKFFFAHGIGANGKSVFSNVIAALMGSYAVTVSAALLTRGKSEGEAERQKFRLIGARLALANETSQGDIWDDQKVKEITSRESIPVRKLYAEAFDFMPTHKLWIRSNHLPGALDNTDGFWRRMTPVHFNVQIPEDERIIDLDRQIIASELPGVLNWALQGCLEWQNGGLQVPASIQAETNRYREETDLLGQWVQEYCKINPNGRMYTKEAFDSYHDFCIQQHVTAPSVMQFSRMLAQLGFKRSPDKRRRGFTGIMLVVVNNRHDDAFDDELEFDYDDLVG